MNIAENIIEAFRADSTLIGYVGDRIFANFAPISSTASGPWLVITRISNDQESAHDGNQHYARCRYEVFVGGVDKEAVDQVRDWMVEKYNGFQYGDVLFFHDNDFDGWEEKLRCFTATIHFVVHVNN